MMKRILCAILTLMLLVSLVPVTAVPASAATYSVTEDAITVLKQLQSFSDHCNQRGYTGYGTKCTKKGTHGQTAGHTILEKDADAALREALKDTVKAVNNFASGLNLSQNQFDALVVFSFQNGNAWMSGSGDFKRAVTKGLDGAEFLDAVCRWDVSPADDHKRMSEANMYLYGVYSSAVPTYFIKVTLDANGGKFTEYGNAATIEKYYDLKDSTAINEAPTMTHSGGTKDGKLATFFGWSKTRDGQERLTKLKASDDGDTLYADWDKNSGSTAIAYTINASQLATPYLYENCHYDNSKNEPSKHYVSGKLKVKKEFVDKDGIRWACITEAEKFYYYNTATKKHNDVEKDRKFSSEWWVKIGKYTSPSVDNSGDSNTTGGLEMDVTVTVTNDYVRSRKNASIFSAQNGTYYRGDKLRIIDTDEGDGFLWGQIAESDEDDTPIGWAALMYTNFEEVRDTDKVVKDDEDSWDNSTVVAKALVNKVSQNNGYVNVRNGAGLEYTIVGSHNYNTMVDLFETKYVNGHQWGRGKTGWFCLTYATVTYTSEYNKEDQDDSGFTYYEFVGTLRGGVRNPNQFYTAIGGQDAGATTLDLAALETKNKIKTENQIGDGKVVGVSNLTLYTTSAGKEQTWGKVNVYGTPAWILLTRNDTGERPYYDLHQAKYVVTGETATIRQSPDTASPREDTLVKGVEFNTSIIVADEMTLWGKVDKVGDKYVDGWVNLSTKYVRRNNGTESDLTDDGNSDGKTMVATIVGAAEVNVRKTGSLSGDKIGTLKEGGTYVILEDDGDGWYNLDVDVDNNPETGSWVYEEYLDIHEKGSSNVTTNGGTSTPSTGIGVVANTYAGVNFRKTPGTAGAFLGKILPGTTLEIRQTKNLGTAVWGKTTVNNVTGWVSMDYVTMVNYKDYGEGEDIYEGSSSSGNTITAAVPAVYTGKVGTAPANDDLDTTTKTSRASTDPLNVSINGRVWDPASQTSGNLIVFSEPDIGSNRVRTLATGDRVTVHEVLSVEEEIVDSGSNNINGFTTMKVTNHWARVNDGYIKAPGNNIKLDTLDENVYTLIDHDKLYVYLSADNMTDGFEVQTYSENDEGYTVTKYALKKGDQVKITEVKIIGNSVRGKIELDTADYSQSTGWIDLSKMGKGAVTVNTAPPATPTQPTEAAPTGPVIGSAGNTGGATGLVQNGGNHLYTGQVVNVGATPLKVRRTASQHAIIETELKNGAALKIYETTISEGMAWGRCDAGWVYLYYVRMTPATGTAIDANVVFNDNTLIYKDSSGGETVGTYQKMAVINIYEKFGDMVRTDLGWVSKANLLHAC